MSRRAQPTHHGMTQISGAYEGVKLHLTIAFREQATTERGRSGVEFGKVLIPLQTRLRRYDPPETAWDILLCRYGNLGRVAEWIWMSFRFFCAFSHSVQTGVASLHEFLNEFTQKQQMARIECTLTSRTFYLSKRIMHILLHTLVNYFGILHFCNDANDNEISKS